MNHSTPDSPLDGLAHAKAGRSRRESVDKRLPRGLPEYGLWEE